MNRPTLIRNLPALLLPLLVALPSAASASGTPSEPYPQAAHAGAKPEKQPDWYRQCQHVKNMQPPGSDLPDGKLSEGLGSCSAASLYYDTLHDGRPSRTAWTVVRACAFTQADAAVLMMLYANGFGVKRNPALAMKYACSMRATPAELSGRVHHLMWLQQTSSKQARQAAKPFDQCDDASSPEMTGVCAEIVERQDTRTRHQQLAALSARLTPAQKEQLDKLWKATQDFAAARAIFETAHAGDGHLTTRIAAASEEKNLLISDLMRTEQGDLPEEAPEQYASLDEQLNLAHQRIMRPEAQTPPASPDVTKGDVHATERAWLNYRDAWIAFGQARYPAVAPQAWGAWLTERRIRQLESLLGETSPGDMR